MNKKKFVLFLTSLLLLSGCNSSQKVLDFTIASKENEVIKLTSSTLLGKSLVQKDSFVLIVQNGNECLCWQNFKDILKNYNENRKLNNNEYIPFFSIDCSIDDFDIDGIDKIKTGYIDLYFYQDGEIIDKISGAAKKNAKIFESLKSFSSFMDEKIKNNPINNLYYISKEYLFENIVGNPSSDKAIVIIERSGCSDCSYCIPNVLIPYAKNNELKIPIYVLDIEKYRSNQNEYLEIKNSLFLSQESSIFGYKEGVVPTYQYYLNGELIDAGVFANDDLEYNYGISFYVKDSYFDGKRNLNYTSTILKDKTFDINVEINEKHSEIFIEFLNYYNT